MSSFDIKFGWRWLLPINRNDSICLVGFSNEEHVFWQEKYPHLQFKTEDEVTDVLIVNAANKLLNLKNATANKLLCVITTRSKINTWKSFLFDHYNIVNEYGLLPAHNPRIVIPLSSRKRVRIALSLHRPGRWFARFAITASLFFSSFGIYFLLRNKVIFIATKLSHPNSHTVDKKILFHQSLLKTHDQDFALYIGTPNEKRKIVVLPLTDSCPEIIFKVALNPVACTSLENEAFSLRLLSESPIADSVPRFAGIATSSNSVTLGQEYRPRINANSNKINLAIVKFLGALSIVERREVWLADILPSTTKNLDTTKNDELNDARTLLFEWLKMLEGQGRKVIVHRTHGDFAPWNYSWTEKGFFVFDWEDSQDSGFALSDAFYSVIAPAMFINLKPKPSKILKDALQLGSQVMEAAMLQGDVKMYFVLWLLSLINRNVLFDALVIRLAYSCGAKEH